MCTVSQISERDPRIKECLETAFAPSPAFVQYLYQRITALNASLEFTRILCETLLSFYSLYPPVSAENVERLAVEDDEKAIGRINRVLAPEGITTAVGQNLVFVLRLKGTIVAPSDAETIHDLRQVPRAAIDLSKLDDYVTLFFCAQAMLAGVKIDPRAEQAA